MFPIMGRLKLMLGLRPSDADPVLVFHALDLFSAESPDVSRGIGVLTEARTGTIYLPDNSNPVIWQSFATGVPGKVYANGKWWLYGGPAGTNEIPWSSDLTNPAWAETAGTENDVIVNGGFATDSDWTKGAGWTIASNVAHCDGTQEANSSLTQTVQPLTAGITYKFVFTISNYSAGGILPRLGSMSGTLRTANGTYIEYITASGTSCHLRANLDFIGDVDDVKVWEAVAQLDAVGLEGVANTATTLTDNDGSGFEFVTETVTIPNDSNTHVIRIFIDKDADETRFPQCNLELSGGTLQRNAVQLNTLSGAIISKLILGAVDQEANQVGDRWELLISVTNNSTGNVNVVIRVYPAITTTFDATEVAATGSIIVGNVELHLNKTIEQVRGSTPIFTSGSTVSVNASDLSFDDANHSDTEGCYYCEFKNVGLDAVNVGGILGLGNNARIIYTNSATNIKSYDGTTVVAGPAVTLSADDVEYKIGLAYGGSLSRVNTDNSWGGPLAYDGTYDNTELKLNVLHNNNLNDVPTFVMLLRNLRRYDLDYVGAQAKIDELMV